MPYLRGWEVTQVREAEIDASGLLARDDEDEGAGRKICADVDSSTLGLFGSGSVDCADETEVGVGCVLLLEVRWRTALTV